MCVTVFHHCLWNAAHDCTCICHTTLWHHVMQCWCLCTVQAMSSDFMPSHFTILVHLFPSVLRHCWLGDRKGIRPVKSSVLVCWWWNSDWSFARLTSPVVTTTSIILSSNKTQNGDILVLANPGPSGKQPLKRTERERVHHICSETAVNNCQMSQFALLETV